MHASGVEACSLPATGTDVFCNSPELLHITLFHMSHPHDPRPCPLEMQASERAAGQPASQRRAPTEAEIHSELALMPHILGSQAIRNVKVWTRAGPKRKATLMLFYRYKASCAAVVWDAKDAWQRLPATLLAGSKQCDTWHVWPAGMCLSQGWDRHSAKLVHCAGTQDTDGQLWSPPDAECRP